MADRPTGRKLVNWRCSNCVWEFKAATIPELKISFDQWARDMKELCDKEFAQHVCGEKRKP